MAIADIKRLMEGLRLNWYLDHKEPVAKFRVKSKGGQKLEARICVVTVSTVLGTTYHAVLEHNSIRTRITETFETVHEARFAGEDALFDAYKDAQPVPSE